MKAVDGYSFPAPSGAVKIEQMGCQYHPHVTDQTAMGTQLATEIAATLGGSARGAGRRASALRIGRGSGTPELAQPC